MRKRFVFSLDATGRRPWLFVAARSFVEGGASVNISDGFCSGFGDPQAVRLITQPCFTDPEEQKEGDIFSPGPPLSGEIVGGNHTNFRPSSLLTMVHFSSSHESRMPCTLLRHLHAVSIPHPSAPAARSNVPCADMIVDTILGDSGRELTPR